MLEQTIKRNNKCFTKAVYFGNNLQKLCTDAELLPFNVSCSSARTVSGPNEPSVKVLIQPCRTNLQ